MPFRPDINLLNTIEVQLKSPIISVSLSRNLPQLRINTNDIVFAPGSDRVLLLESKVHEIDPKREIDFARLICNVESVHLLLVGKTAAIDGLILERKTFLQLKDRTGADYNASRAMPVDEFIRVWGKTHGWSSVELYIRTQAPIDEMRKRWFMRGVQPEIDPQKHLTSAHVVRVVAYGFDGHVELPCQVGKWMAAGGTVT